MRAFGLAVLFLAFVASTSNSLRGDDIKLPKDKGQFHVYLLIGQSNMAGRGAPADPPADPPARLLKLDKNDEWVPATDPLHFDKPAIAGVGPGSGFGRAMVEAFDEHVTVGLIPCAFGGTPLRRWQPGADLYEEAVRRTKLAQQVGVLKGVIWHQGEAETRDEQLAKSYAVRLTKTIEGLRHDLHEPKLPFVAGELGRFLSDEKYPYAKLVNQQLHDVAATVPFTEVISSDGANAKPDGVHFDTAGALLLGRRYAEAMQMAPIK